jgi:site-specific DNA recombinase
MRAVIYCRVSDDDRQDGRSVGEQERECRESANEHGWTVDQVYVDNDRSASRYARRERKGHQQMLVHLRQEAVNALILWESSRGDRELERWAALLNLCRNRDIKVHIATHHRTYDLSRPRDWRTLAEDGVDSAYESDKTRERVLRAVRSQASRGLPHGRLLYGYRREYDDRGRFVAQVERTEQAAVVRECVSRVAGGEPLYTITADLNERGIPAPQGGKWIPTQIKRLATNPGYAGQRVHRGQVIGPADWPALVDEATYAEAVRRMSDPRRNSIRDRSLKHLLSGLLQAPCGGRTRVLSNRGYPTYICHTDYCVAVRTTPVEAFVVDMVVSRLEQPDVLQALATHGARKAASDGGTAEELQARLNGFYAEAAEGKISPGGLAAIEARLIPQIEQARQRAMQAPVSQLVLDVAGPGARARWEALAIGQRREVVDKLCELRVARTVRGSRFDFHRLGESRWRGDPKTWADYWETL